MTREILIVGASGFLGRHLAEHLMNRGFDVIVDTPCSSGNQSKADLGKFNETLKLLEKTKPSVVINCVGVTPQREKLSTYSASTNFEISRNLISATKIVGVVDTFISIGSALEFGFGDSPAGEVDYEERQPESEYGWDKRHATNYLLEQKEKTLSVIILRPTTVYGAGQNSNMLIPQLLRAVRNERGPVPVKHPDDMRDYLHVNDFVEAVERILLYEGRALNGHFNIGSGHLRSAKDVAKLVARLSGVSLSEIALFAETKDLSVSRSLSLSTHLFSKTFGWNPKVSIVDGLQNEIDLFLLGEEE